jgi:imidazolonepropionase-like amidohydrolase
MPNRHFLSTVSTVIPRACWALALAALLPAPARCAGASSAPGAPGVEGGLALRASKALVVGEDGRGVVNDAVVLVRDGRIEAVGPAHEVPIPAGYEVHDFGPRWLMPGMIDLHNHTASGNPLTVNDLNDMVMLANPGLRASTGVKPQNLLLRRAVAGGVTTVLYIPGSGTNMSGQGVLLKTGEDTYERMEIRNPGSLKLAQAGNPEGWTVGVGRSFMNWDTRNMFLRGAAYAKRWRKYEAGEGPKPEKDLQLEIFRALYNDHVRVSVHTQIFQVVLMTITMVREELGLDVFIDHGSFDGYKTAELAQKEGVPAILGPREIHRSMMFHGGGMDTDGRIVGMAAEYQKRGHTMIGFNTDCIDDGSINLTPPQEELSLQAGLGVRYGMDNSHMDAVRGLTIIPAKTAGIDQRVGSLMAGKDADILVVTGDPLDPRSWVEAVYVDGKRVYDAEDGERLW